MFIKHRLDESVGIFGALRICQAATYSCRSNGRTGGSTGAAAYCSPGRFTSASSGCSNTTGDLQHEMECVTLAPRLQRLQAPVGQIGTLHFIFRCYSSSFARGLLLNSRETLRGLKNMPRYRYDRRSDLWHCFRTTLQLVNYIPATKL